LRVTATQPAETVVGDPVEEVGGKEKRPCLTPQQFSENVPENVQAFIFIGIAGRTC
jgi:hypothetical protein